MRLFADQSALETFTRRRLAHAVYWAVGCVAVATAILVIEYRLMLFAIVVLAVPTVLLIIAIRSKRTLAGVTFCQLELGDGFVTVSTSAESATIPFGELINTRVAEDHIIVAHRNQSGLIRGWIIPGDDAAIRQFAAALEGDGVPIIVERQVGRKLAALFAGVILWKVLGVVAAGLVLGALANIVSALVGGGGSIVLGLGLLGGAVVCLTVVVLTRMKITGT